MNSKQGSPAPFRPPAPRRAFSAGALVVTLAVGALLGLALAHISSPVVTVLVLPSPPGTGAGVVTVHQPVAVEWPTNASVEPPPPAIPAHPLQARSSASPAPLAQPERAGSRAWVIRETSTRSFSASIVARPVPIVGVVAALPVAREQAARPGAPSQPPAPASAAQQPTFRASVDLVTTDVRVRDRKGSFVPDLTSNDFEVFEDGVRQKVVSMILVHGGRVYNSLTAPPPTAQEGVILPPARPSQDESGRVFILFVDDLHLDFGGTGRVRSILQKIRKELIHEGDLFGVVSTGPSSVAVDLTYDTRRLDEAIRKIAGSGLKPNDIVEGGSTSEGPTQVRYLAHVAFSAAHDLLQNLEQVRNRRKALIYLSDGYDFNPFAESRLAFENSLYGSPSGSATPAGTSAGGSDDTDVWNRQATEFSEADLTRELADLIRSANRANVSIYAIDPRGLTGGPDLDQKVSATEWQDYVRRSQDSLRVLADQTGGLAIVNQNDFDGGLARIDAETSDYYVIGYYSSNPDPLKRNRRIDVKVKRAGVEVWARKGYTIKQPPKGKAK